MDIWIIVMFFIAGLIIAIPMMGIYSLVDFIKIMEEESEKCKQCDSCRDCVANKNIPIMNSKWLFEFTLLSYIFIKNKCKYISKIFKKRTLVFMCFNGILYAFIYCMCGITISTFVYCLCTTILIHISVIDWNTQYIPVEYNIMILILGLINLFCNIDKLLEYIIGLFAVSGFLLLVNFVGSKVTEYDGVIGGGDIKLMAAAGLLLGWKLNLLALMIGCVLGAIIHLIIMAIKKGNHVLAFGPYLSMGIFIAMIWGQWLVSWYLSMAGLDKLVY